MQEKGDLKKIINGHRSRQVQGDISVFIKGAGIYSLCDKAWRYFRQNQVCHFLNVFPFSNQTVDLIKTFEKFNGV